MGDEDRLFQMITKIYGEMQEGFQKVDKRLDSMDSRLDNVDSRLNNVDSRLDSVDSRLDSMDSRLNNVEKEIRKTNIKIENDIKPKIDALFDGYKQNTESLARIEEEVSKHEEIILRKIR